MNITNDDDGRRAYWTEQMDRAFAFMEAMAVYPVEECGERLVSIPERAEALGVEMRFSDRLINQRFPRLYFVREGIVESLCAAAETFSRRGWVLKLEDGYRSPEMQRGQFHNPANFDRIMQKVLWEVDGARPDPELVMRRVSAMIATRCRVGTHVSASAVDVSLFDRKSGEEIDRGHPYVEFSECTPMASPFVTPEQRRNRETITEVLLSHGWHAYPYEYWHYSNGDCYAEHLAGTGRAARYNAVHFDEATGEMTPLPPAQRDAWLETPTFFQQQIDESLARLNR